MYANPAVCKLLEYTQGEMIGKHEFDLWGPKTVKIVKNILATDRKRGISSSYEGGVIAKSGKRIDILSHGTPIPGGGTVVILTDISYIKRKDEALAESEEKYRNLIESAQEGITIVDSNERYTFVNQNFADSLGYTVEELTGKHLSEMVTPEDFKKLSEETIKRKKGFKSKYDVVFFHKNGQPRHFALSASPLFDKNGKFIGSMGICKDFTELKKKDEELAKSEKRFKNMANLLPQAVFEISAKGKLLFVNQEAYKMFGYTENNFNEWSNPFKMISKKDKSRAIGDMNNMLRTKQPISAEYTASRKDGTTFPASVHVNPILKENKTIGIRGILIDMTESKRAKELTIKLRSATEQSLDGVAMADLTGKIEFINPAWAKMHGYRAKELIGKHLSIFHTKEQMKEEVSVFNEKVFKTGGHQGEINHLRKDGSEFPTFMSSTLIRDEKSQPIGLVGTARDITKQKEAERTIEKRVREFNVLYRVHSHIKMANRLSKVLTDISHDVVHALKFTDIAQACILFDSKNYESSNYCEKFKHKVEEPIIINGKKRGVLMVGYTQAPPKKQKEFFWHAERKLIKTIAGVIERHILSREVYERYQKIVQKSVTGIFILDNGIIKEANSRFGKMFKCKTQDAIGRNISEFITDYSCGSNLSKSSASSYSCVAKGVRKDSKIIDIDIVAQSISFNGKEGILGRVHDITKLKAAEEKLHSFNEELKEMVAEKTHHLELANKRLQSLNELKDEFIAISSHELRSPLTSIRGYLSFLVEKESLEEIPESSQQYLMRAYNNAESLNYLVNNILDVSRLGTGRFELQIVKYDLIQLVQNVIDGLSFQISEKNLNIKISNSTKSDQLLINVDTIRLTQVLRNLLDNAIKFSNRGKAIVVKIDIDSQFVIVKVIDEGIGIPKLQIKHIFDKFIQVKSNETKNKGGAGLGLFISKRIIELHNGTMSAESVMHKGTVFTIKLPLK